MKRRFDNLPKHRFPLVLTKDTAVLHNINRIRTRATFRAVVFQITIICWLELSKRICIHSKLATAARASKLYCVFYFCSFFTMNFNSYSHLVPQSTKIFSLGTAGKQETTCSPHSGHFASFTPGAYSRITE